MSRIESKMAGLTGAGGVGVLMGDALEDGAFEPEPVLFALVLFSFYTIFNYLRR